MGRSINGMAERFRARLESDDTVAMPGCYDVFSALIMQDAGFEAVFVSGYGVAASLLGNPDIGLTTLSETTQMANNVVRAIGIPAVVDVDNGYGNEENVSRTIYEMEAAGVAGIQLEDQVFPKRCGHSEGKVVLPMDKYLRKLDAALRARQTPLVIIARTDSSDLDDAITRARAFLDAGADAVIVDGLANMEAMKRVGKSVSGNKQLNLLYGGKTPMVSVAEAQALGFKILLYSTPALYVAARAVRQCMGTLKSSGKLQSIADQSMPFEEFQSFIEQNYRKRKHLAFLNQSRT
jgi:2,3-dimethylmalate lyase